VVPVEARWSVDQVMAAAPDSASQVAGRRLARPGPWSAIGLSDGLLWGECQGSGKTPYRVTVDTATRRYQCSCPSRKFPCKHALGLLFLWAQGQIDESGAVAGFAQDFADRGRPAREATPYGGSTEQTPEQRAAAAARAAAREQRVADGLADLDRWLADQVAGGLARVAQDPYGWAETAATRMVDAQAPGVAAWLRRLPAVVASGPRWPQRLLDELALLHLLARGYARRAELPADLVATVRDHVGFTVSRAAVLAGPPVRDRWVIVGFRDLDTETVSTRRVWLRGTGTGRWAQVLFFAAGGGTLDSSLVPATVVDADLHFYPGRAGLRAAIGATHTEPVPATDWRPPADTVTAAADRWAAAVAADPWQHQIPVVLRGRVDCEHRADDVVWSFTDPAGAAVAVHGTDLDLWRLLALTAGITSDVAGEWSPRGFRPSTVLVDGRMVVL
jgi:hypothetical protein